MADVESRLHYSSRTERWMPCVALKSCWYSEHSTPVEIARTGGGEVAVHKRPQTITPLIRGGYAIKTKQRSQTFREDGTRMTPTEARAWRKQVAIQQEINRVVNTGKVEHVPAAPELTQREKAAKHAADLEARRRAKMIVQPELTRVPKTDAAGISGYDAFLAAKKAREEATQAEAARQPVPTAPETKQPSEPPAAPLNPASPKQISYLASLAKRPMEQGSELRFTSKKGAGGKVLEAGAVLSSEHVDEHAYPTTTFRDGKTERGWSSQAYEVHTITFDGSKEQASKLIELLKDRKPDALPQAPKTPVDPSPRDPGKSASAKQIALIKRLYQNDPSRSAVEPNDYSKLTMGQASRIIDQLMGDG